MEGTRDIETSGSIRGIKENIRKLKQGLRKTNNFMLNKPCIRFLFNKLWQEENDILGFLLKLLGEKQREQESHLFCLGGNPVFPCF